MWKILVELKKEEAPLKSTKAWKRFSSSQAIAKTASNKLNCDFNRNRVMLERLRAKGFIGSAPRDAQAVKRERIRDLLSMPLTRRKEQRRLPQDLLMSTPASTSYHPAHLRTPQMRYSRVRAGERSFDSLFAETMAMPAPSGPLTIEREATESKSMEVLEEERMQMYEKYGLSGGSMLAGEKAARQVLRKT